MSERQRRRGTDGTLLIWARALAVGLGLLGLWLAVPVPALARDCDEPNDCAIAATTARNPLVPIAATGAGAGTAVLIDAVRRKPDPGSGEEEQESEDSGLKVPCQQNADELAQAQAYAKYVNATLRRSRDLLAATEQMYEAQRFKATMFGGIDAAFGIAGLHDPGGRGLAGEMLIASMKNVVKEGVKQTLTGFFIGDVEVDFSKLGMEGYKGPRKTAMLSALKEALEQQALEQALDPGGSVPAILGAPKGVGLSGPVGDAARRGVKTWANELADNYLKLVGGLMDIIGTAQSASKDADALAKLRETMSDLRQRIFRLETELDTDAIPAVKDALSAYRGCLQIWIDRHGDDWMEQWVLYYGKESLAALRASGILRHVGGAGMRMP